MKLDIDKKELIAGVCDWYKEELLNNLWQKFHNYCHKQIENQKELEEFFPSRQAKTFIEAFSMCDAALLNLVNGIPPEDNTSVLIQLLKTGKEICDE